MVLSAGAGKHKAANKQNGNGFPDDLRRASHPHALLQKSVMNTDDFNLVERAAPNLFGSPSSATVPSPLLAPPRPRHRHQSSHTAETEGYC